LKKILSVAVLVMSVSFSLAYFTAVPSHGANDIRPLTRLRVAYLIARRADLEKASSDDHVLIKKIALEFRDEMEYLGFDIKSYMASMTGIADVDRITSPDAGLSRSMDVVPIEHWVYDALSQLASRGVI
jgi:hypothetical protein